LVNRLVDPAQRRQRDRPEREQLIDPRRHFVRGRELWTSTSLYSFKGITQKAVIDAWQSDGRIARECDFTLAQVYSADEAFVTGTLGGVTPVTRVDGRAIGNGKPGALTEHVSRLYLDTVVADGAVPINVGE
jgi:branched-chain amino acid aminotransferase